MKSVAESDFRKSSGLYINNSDGVLLLVKLQAFTVNDSERVNDRSLLLASGCGGSVFS